jgi:hypothetical protein
MDMLPTMPRQKQLPDELFIRMPADTKRRLEALAGAVPVPATWLRQFLLDAIDTAERRRGSEHKKDD